MTIVRSHGGIVLDLITDCVSCVFPNNVFPFQIMDDGSSIKDVCFDDKGEFPRYRLEDKNGRLKVQRLPGFNCTEV